MPFLIIFMYFLACSLLLNLEWVIVCQTLLPPLEQLLKLNFAVFPPTLLYILLCGTKSFVPRSRKMFYCFIDTM